MPAFLGPAIADDHAICPSFEAGRIAQAAEVAPDRDKGLLDRVLRGVAITEHSAGDEEQPRRHVASEPLVRVPITALRLFDQPLVHLAALLGRPGWGVHPISGASTQELSTGMMRAG